MKKINQYKLLAGICALSLFTACDFEELNTNPFEMTDEMGIRVLLSEVLLWRCKEL